MYSKICFTKQNLKGLFVYGNKIYWTLKIRSILVGTLFIQYTNSYGHFQSVLWIRNLEFVFSIFVDPDTYSEYGSGSTQANRKKAKIVRPVTKVPHTETNNFLLYQYFLEVC